LINYCQKKEIKNNKTSLKAPGGGQQAEVRILKNAK
jgi:hypothetical protein